MDEALRRSAAHVLTTEVDLPILSDEVTHHLQRVLRLREGELVTVTNGRGSWRECRWTGSGVEISGEVQMSAERSQLEVAVAIPKGDRLEWMVQKLVEIGVDRIQLLTTERSVVRWDAQRTQKHLERLQRVVESAIEQSRRVWNCEIVGPVAARDFLVNVPIAEPGGRSMCESDRSIAIGPEGGWADGEIAISPESISLSSQVLRVETAAVVAATLMAAYRGWS